MTDVDQDARVRCLCAPVLRREQGRPATAVTVHDQACWLCDGSMSIAVSLLVELMLALGDAPNMSFTPEQLNEMRVTHGGTRRRVFSGDAGAVVLTLYSWTQAQAAHD